MLAVTAVTLVLAFLGGIVYDAVLTFGEVGELGKWETLTHPEFWPLFGQFLPEVLPEYRNDLLMALGFGALGSFGVLRAAFAGRTPEAETQEAPAPGAAPAPVADANTWTPDAASAGGPAYGSAPAGDAAPSAGTTGAPGQD